MFHIPEWHLRRFNNAFHISFYHSATALISVLRRSFLFFSHFLLQQVPDLPADVVCLVLLIIGLEEAELVLVRDGESDKRSKQRVLEAAF